MNGNDTAEFVIKGNGGGMNTEITPTLVGDHQNRITDYTAVMIIDHSRRHDYQPMETVPTMEAHMGTGGGNVPLVLFTPKRYAEYAEELPTLRASGGDVGGGVKD